MEEPEMACERLGYCDYTQCHPKYIKQCFFPPYLACDYCGYRENSVIMLVEFLSTKIYIVCPKCGVGELVPVLFDSERKLLL